MVGQDGHDGAQAVEALTRHERVALLDIAYGVRPYIWRQASMLKLEARSLVRRTGVTYRGKPG